MDQLRLERLLALLHSADGDRSVVERICLACVKSGSLDGVGVSRIFRGTHDMVAASDTNAAVIEALQITFAEGPCLSAVESAAPCMEPDLTSKQALRRWPRFSRAAIEQGVVATFAFPLTTGGVTIGALDVYSRVRGDLQADQIKDASLLAELAALSVDRSSQAPEAISGVALGTESPEPWTYPSVVHNASGIVSVQLNVTLETALLRLRALAFATGQKVTDVSRDVVQRRLQLEAWVGDD